MASNIPILILALIPLVMVIRFLYYMVDNKTNNIKLAKCVDELKFSDYKTGFKTTGFSYRFLYLAIIYACFLSIFIHTNIILISIITIIILFIGILTNNESKVFKFYIDSFTVRKYFHILSLQQEFFYSEIHKVEYLYGGYGTVQMRIYKEDGKRKIVSFKPGYTEQDNKLIELILKEKTNFEKNRYKWNNIID